MSHFCIVVNLDRCTGCHGCEVACKTENGIPLGQYWNKVLTVGPQGAFPDVELYFLPAMCQQCEDAPCVHVCPTGASYRDEAGRVLVDKSKCIGCRYCMMACPYGIRSMNEDEHVVEKCTLCSHLTNAGELPACVELCATKARFYGDLDDPNSDVSKELAKFDRSCIHEMTNVGNNPATKYILSPKYAEWQDLKEVSTR